jgi:hypothetical protein
MTTGIDVTTAVINAELRIAVLERTVELLLSRIPVVGPVISPTEIRQIQAHVLARLREKYPSVNIDLSPVTLRVRRGHAVGKTVDQAIAAGDTWILLEFKRGDRAPSRESAFAKQDQLDEYLKFIGVSNAAERRRLFEGGEVELALAV